MVGEVRPPTDSKLPPLAGYDPYDTQPWIVAIASSATAIGFFSVVLRLLSRRINAQPWWWDDWMIIWSGAWSLSALGLLFSMRKLGLGLHADVVDPKNVETILQWLIASETLYAWSLGWTKLSVLLMYYRVFRVKQFKIMAYAIGALVMAWVVCITFLFVFTCVPVEKLWHPELEGHCISQVGTYVSNGVSSIITDIIILLLPGPHIWKLQARRAVKVGLCISFGLGGVVVFVSSYRVSVLLTYDKSDPSYTLTPTVGWTAIELSAGFVSANLPTMLPVLAFIGRWLKKAKIIKSISGSQDMSKKSKSSGLASTDPGRSFYRMQETARDTRGGSAAKSANHSVYVHDDDSWEGTGHHVMGREDFRDREREVNKSGESILLEELRSKDLEAQGPQGKR